MLFFLLLGTYSQYDGIVLPEKPAASVLQSIGKSVVNFFSRGNKFFPNHEIVQEKSLLLFLAKFKKALMEKEIASMDRLKFTECVTNIYHIYECLRKQTLCQGSINTRELNWIAANLTKVHNRPEVHTSRQ